MNDLDAADLRRNLDEYLRRAAGGESFLVTEAGQPVAALTPPLTLRERLIAEGRLIPAKGDLLNLGPPPPLEREHLTGITPAEALEEQREERIP
jgi:prevent-host-death family protein